MKKLFILFAFLGLLVVFPQVGKSQDQMAINFIEKDTAGQPFNLSSLRGSYVLVDFWASWCPPCRADIKEYVKPLWDQYKNKNFKIVGVSLDNSKDAWLNFIKKYQMDWINVSDLRGWGSSVARLYGIQAIPQNVLVDPKGKVIGRNLRGYALANKLKELFDESKASVN